MTKTPAVRPRPARLKLVVLLLGLLALAGVVYKGLRLWPPLSSLLGRARELQTLAGADRTTLASSENLVWLREQLGHTQQDLRIIRAEIGPLFPLAERLHWLPRIGGDLAAAPALLDMAIHLSDAGWWGLLGFEPVMDAVFRADRGSGQTALEAALPALTVSRPRFAEAEDALVQVSAARERFKTRRLSPRLAKWVTRLDRYLPALEAGTQLAQALPEVMGRERPVTYLILMQNNHELRATGGFISGVGTIQLSAGKIITTTFQDSYQVDAACDLWAHPPAPEPLRRYMWAPVLVFRDANWSPDFPSSAVVAMSIYRMCQSSDVNGVIAIDLDGVSALLQGLGPLQPEGYPAAVTAETLLQFITDYWASPLRSADTAEEETGDWWLHRKDFVADVLQAALHKVTTSLESIDLSSLALSTLDALRNKHLLVYLHDPAAARAMTTAAWDGAFLPTVGDYLMVVDSNVGFRKVNPNIRQHVDYRVHLSQSETPRAALTLRYTNESEGSPECFAGARYEDSYQEMMQGCYWDYVRVYVPRGSRLLSVMGSDSKPEISEEAGKATFSAFSVVPPGESRELVFTYELPSAVIEDLASPEYSLLIQKQAGSPDVPVHVSLSGGDWQLDSPIPDATLGGDGTQLRFNLASDTLLTWVALDTRRGSTWPWAVAGIVGAITALAGFVLWRRASPD